MPRRKRHAQDSELSVEVERLREQLRTARLVLEGDLDVHRAELETANAQLREAAHQMQRSRERYVELYDLAPVAYLTLDRHGLITELNLPAAALLGEVRALIVGRPLMVYAADESRGQVLDHVRRCRRDSRPVVTELLLRQKRGGSIPVELSSRATPAPGPGAHHFHSVLLDLTERRRAAEALRRSERLAALGTLTAGVAHEIKNPLHAILLSAQMLERHSATTLSPDERTMLASINEDVHRCDRIIKNMLAFARDEPTEKWPVDLNVIVRRSVGVARAYNLACELELELAHVTPWVRANPTEIEQVLMNLIRNAAEASPTGCAVRIGTATGAKRVRLTVVDNGPGIPADRLAHVFDPFFTTRRGSGGTGLGLSIVHAIVTDHAGTIHVESAPGQGTRFTAEFPYVQNSEREAESGADPGN